MSNTMIPSVLWSADQTGVLSSDDIARAKANIGLATAVVLKGSATVAQLNSMTQDGEHVIESGLATGWQFTMSDSGTLRAGLLVVSFGDKVVWNGSSWEMAGGAGGGAYVLNAGYNTSTKVWTLPSQADFDNLDSSGSVLLKVARTDASGNSAGISWYDLTYKFEDSDVGMTNYTFTGTSTMENVDGHPQKIQLYLPDSDNQPTATVTTYPIIRNYYANPASSLYPTASEINTAIRTNNDVVILQGARQQGGDYYYAAANNAGNIVFSRAAGIDESGSYSSARITLDTTDNTWSYSSYNAFIDGGYEILNWSAAADQPVHNKTHLISCSGSNQPTLIYISKCHAAKMYEAHCMLAYHALKLYNDDNSSFSSYTVYDNRVNSGQADTPYVLTRGKGVALWTETNTHGVTAHFLIVGSNIYISYGY